MDMNYVDSFDLFGVKARQKACIPGEGAPTPATKSAVGDLYMDTLTGNIYKCVSVRDGVYAWQYIDVKPFIVDVLQNEIEVNSSADEIYGVYSSGIPVVLRLRDRFLTIVSSRPTLATFIDLKDDNTLCIHCVDDNGTYTKRDLQTGGGGSNEVLFVKVYYSPEEEPGNQYSTTHTSEQIYDHVSGGGAVVLEYNFTGVEYIFNLSQSTDDLAVFYSLYSYEQGAGTAYDVINIKGSIVTTDYVPFCQDVREQLGDISTALDHIIALQEELIGL